MNQTLEPKPPSGEPVPAGPATEDATPRAEVDPVELDDEASLTGPFEAPSEAELKLRRWRAGYEARRAEAAERLEAERRRRRRRAFRVAGGLAGAALLAGGWALLRPGAQAPSAEQAAPVDPGVASAERASAAPASTVPAPPEPATEVDPAPEAAPVATDERVAGGGAAPRTEAGDVAEATVASNEPAADGEAPPRTEAGDVAEASVAPDVSRSAFDLELVEGSLKVWSADETEWVFFDYRGTDPIDLRWTDAAGREALDPVTCTNKVRRGVRRCFVGRTHERIAVAQAHAGAVPGTWTVSACAAGDPQRCTRIASFEVPDLAGR